MAFVYCIVRYLVVGYGYLTESYFQSIICTQQEHRGNYGRQGKSKSITRTGFSV